MDNMILISIFAGLLSTMNVWANSVYDIRFHLNDVYMASLMTCWMILLTQLLNGSHATYTNVSTCTILIITIFLIIGIRHQIFIDDRQFLEGMIPHHSMAILMSKRILKKTNNNKIKKLASDIINSQQKEIKIMNDILNEK